MEVAFVYGTVHQFVLTTEATLLKDTGYVQILLALGFSDCPIKSWVGIVAGSCERKITFIRSEPLSLRLKCLNIARPVTH